MFEKMKMSTKNYVDDKMGMLLEIFPNCFTEVKDSEGSNKTVIDFDLLKQELSTEIVDGIKERYRLEWPGKKEAILKSNSSINKTLRPISSESLNFNKSKNIYIEGDNLESLKLLQESYLNKIKMIYIDPPYNTGKDFVYRDNYSIDKDDELEQSGQLSEEGRLVTNLESNGRYHSDWLTMMYSRIKLSRNLLKDNGILFISIDDHEVHNLKKICDEIYGEKNFLGDIIWNSTKSVTNTAIISVSHTHNLVYFKNIEYYVANREEFRLPEDGDGFANPDNDSRGPWKADPFQVGGWRPNQQYEIINPNTGKIYTPNSGCSWKNDYKKFLELEKDGRIIFGTTGEGGPQRKRFLYEAEDRGKVTKTLWDDIETTTNGTQLLKKLFDNSILFTNPKPISLITRMLQLSNTKNEIILDFFSGSATTAHAVMQLNAEDGGNRRFIMVQIPEETDEKSEAYKAGYKTICEIGKERIRRAGTKILEENKDKEGIENLDIGFRVFKVDSSNMKDVYYNPDEIRQDNLFDMVSNIKEDRTDLDLLFQVLLDSGVELTLPIEEKQIAGKKVYFVDGNVLAACFEDNLTEEFVTELAQCEDLLKVVFRDSSFGSDDSRINVEQIFKQYSPDTQIRVI